MPPVEVLVPELTLALGNGKDRAACSATGPKTIIPWTTGRGRSIVDGDAVMALLVQLEGFGRGLSPPTLLQE